MCGIVGILNLANNPVSPATIRRMAAAIAHRGPDGEGTYANEHVGLGHRRLAIIDLSPAGHQPMATADGRYVITYNGEIYNFQELRIELEALGHQFHSRSDTEVLLHAYAQWGEDALLRLNGMFAFALWDNQEKTLFLARDRFGIKPLYWARVGSDFVFASEIKALTVHPAFRASLDREGLLEYFTFQNFFSDRTLHAGVHLLPAATWMRFRAGSGEAPQTRRYWDFAFVEPDEKRSDADYEEELDFLLKRAVMRQLVSDVDVGAYLSGGMDSGAITALAATDLPYLKSFTCGFDLHSASGIEVSFDERERAELMSYRFKTEHYEMVLKAGDMERVLPELVHHLEEPRVGQSYPNYYVARLAAKFVKVVLSGAGGDELFGGYPWRYYRAVDNQDFEDYANKYYAYWQRLVPEDLAPSFFSPIYDVVRNVSTRDIFRSVFEPQRFSVHRPEEYVNHSLYFEARTFLHGILVVEDKLSMAHGMETRVPFLDNDLVDFAMRLPVRLKLAKLDEVMRVNENLPGRKRNVYFGKTNDGKVLLRRVMSRHIPREIADGEKQGFSAPDASWFKGESIDYVRRLVLGSNARIYEYLDRATVARLVDDHLEGRENRRLLIWSLLNFEWWLRKFLP